MDDARRNLYNECKLYCDSDHMYGDIHGNMWDSDGMPQSPTALDVILHREKPELKRRKNQIAINLLALDGGEPYVKGRLSRFSGESAIDWHGGERADGSCATGRLQQTHAFPYLARIAAKKNQYIFSEDPLREGADEDVLKDITRDGRCINDLMRIVSDNLFAAQGGWIGIDAPPAKEDGTEYSVAEKESGKIRPYWQFYSRTDVTDWKRDEKGELLWLKTRGVEVIDENPMKPIEFVKVIKLWERTQVTCYRIREKKDGRFRGGKKADVEVTTTPLINSAGQPLGVVPFVECGKLTGKPIAFDDLERINRSIMDLGSVDRANLFKTVYPQMVLPSDVLSNSANYGYGSNAVEAASMILGFNYPVAEDEQTKGITRYVTPNASDLAIIGERIKDLERRMFDMVGLAMEQESRQVASAEAKAWDFLDVSSVMRASAEQLEDIESKCVDLMIKWDSSVKPWTPVYNRDFDVGNFKDEMSGLIMAANVSMPAEMYRELLTKIYERLNRLGAESDKETQETVRKAIAEYSAEIGVEVALGLPTPEVGSVGGDDQ